MFTVIGVMLGGMLIGFLLRRQEFSWIGKVITLLIWALLFLLGIEVGGRGTCHFGGRGFCDYISLCVGQLYFSLGIMVFAV